VINFLYLFDVNLPALLFCRRPQRSWARPCCCASKSRKSFGVCTLLRAHNKANIIVQPHLSVHRHEVILWVRDVLVQHDSQFSICQMQMGEMLCSALWHIRCFLHREMRRDADQRYLFCRFLQVCEMCRLYRSCMVQAVFGSLSCMSPHG